jgi:DNA-binding NarL/FixJ family response regulator
MTVAALRLMLIDEDPVFRLGLRIWLEQSAGYQVVAEASQGEEALAILTGQATPTNADPWTDTDLAQSPSTEGDAPAIDVVVLDLGLGRGDPQRLPGLQLCADIKALYPALPVLVLSAQTEPVLEAAARQMGADDFAPRGLAVRDLGRLIQRLSQVQMASTETESTPREAWIEQPRGEQAPVPGALTALRISLRLSSVQQIEATLAAIAAQQRQGRRDPWTEAVLAGRQRELRAARWLVRRLLATPHFSDQWQSIEPPPSRATSGPRAPAIPPSPGQPRRFTPPGDNPWALENTGLRDIIPTATSQARLALAQGDLATIVFERVFAKLQGPLTNLSTVPLEIDILRDDKKRELLFLMLRQLEEALDNLRRANILPGQLPEKSPLVLQDVWEAAITDFFGRYYTLQVDNLEQPVVSTLLGEAEVVQMAILNQIPLVPMVLGHLLFKESVIVDGSPYVASTPEALNRSQELVEHLLIQLANAAVQPLLNCFADVELLKKNLYQRRMITSRDIERFRNELSWRYRWDGLIYEPKAIFESQYRLFGFRPRGIDTHTIYAPRRQELDQLSGLQRTVTVVIEARDAIAPRFRSAVSLVGSSLVYVLTDVIGRGIGLVGRGILRGIGSAWRDPRYRPENHDSEDFRP